MAVDPMYQPGIAYLREVATTINDHADQVEAIIDGVPGANASILSMTMEALSGANLATLPIMMVGSKKQLQDYVDNL
jgi:hypothetical protein